MQYLYQPKYEERCMVEMVMVPFSFFHVTSEWIVKMLYKLMKNAMFTRLWLRIDFRSTNGRRLTSCLKVELNSGIDSILL